MIPGSYLDVIIGGGIMITILSVIVLFLWFRVFKNFQQGHHAKTSIYLMVSSAILLLIISLTSAIKQLIEVFYQTT